MTAMPHATARALLADALGGHNKAALIDSTIDFTKFGQKANCVVLYRLTGRSPLTRLALRITLRYDTSYPEQGSGTVQVYGPTGWVELWSLRGEYMTDTTPTAFGKARDAGLFNGTYEGWLTGAYVADLSRMHRVALDLLGDAN